MLPPAPGVRQMLWQLKNTHLRRSSARLGHGLNWRWEQFQKRNSSSLSVRKTIHLQLGMAVLTHQLCSCQVEMRQLVSPGLCRSQGRPVCCFQTFISSAATPRASLQQHGGSGCLGVLGHTQQWGLSAVPLAGRCQALPSLLRFGGLESYRGFPKSHQLLLWAISKKDKGAFLPHKNTAQWGSLRSPEWTGSDLLFDFGVEPQLSNNLVKRPDSGSLLLSQPIWGVPLCALDTTVPGAL